MDIVCQAKSGMGKTAVFVLATLHQLNPQAGEVRGHAGVGRGWGCLVPLFATARSAFPAVAVCWSNDRSSELAVCASVVQLRTYLVEGLIIGS